MIKQLKAASTSSRQVPFAAAAKPWQELTADNDSNEHSNTFRPDWLASLETPVLTRVF